MKTAKVMESPEDSAREQSAPLPDAAQRQLDALRAAIDSRLRELDSALADPASAPALPGLILELSRLATAEAQAAAARACLQIKHDSEATLLEQEARSAAAVDTERRAASELRRTLESVQKRLDVAETERHAAVEAAREQARQVEGERNARLDLDRTITTLERQLEDARNALAESQDATKTAERSGSEARGRVDELERRATDLQQRLSREEQSNRDLTTERVKSGDRIAELELLLEALQAKHDTLERTLAEERAQARAYALELERQLVDVRQQVTGAQDEAARAREDAAAVRDAAARSTQDGDAARTRAIGLEHELEEALQRVAAEQANARTLQEARESADGRVSNIRQELDDARAQLAQVQAALDARSRELVDAMARATREADARDERERALAEQAQSAEHASGRIQDLEHQLAERSRELAEERRALVDLEKQLASERAISTDLRAAVTDAHTTVDGDQETLTLLRQAASDAEVRLADMRSGHATLQAAHDALARELDSSRERALESTRRHDELTAFVAQLQATLEEQRQHGGSLHAAVEDERRLTEQLRQQADRVASERDALTAELEKLTAAYQAADDERKQAGPSVDASVDTALQQAQADVAAARADVAALRERLAAVESARASADELSLDMQERVAVVERERDALSLALDTERMMSADLRRASATGAPAAPAAAATAFEDEGEGDVAELTFDEDLGAPDDAIAIGDTWNNVRLFTRYSFTSRVDVKLNNASAMLADLSVGGCGVRTTQSLATGDMVRVGLPGDLTPLLCLGKVIWTRPEPAADKLPAGHRVGIKFTQADEAALEAFIIMRADL